MSYPESILTISPKLSELKQKVNFTFKNNNEFSSVDTVYVKVKIILDVVYLKKEINILEQKISKNNDKERIIEINDFKLCDIEENNLFNISTLNFEFYNNGECQQLLSEKKLILQVIKDKGEVLKNII